jgi:hypothetical protein
MEENQSKTWVYLSKVLSYALILYIFYILGHAIWLNWSLKKENDQLKKDIVAIQEKNQNLENLILYYKSDSFKELETREKLGLKKKDEKVVSVPVRKYNNDQSQAEATINSLNKKPVEKIANWRAWWAFLFQ